MMSVLDKPLMDGTSPVVHLGKMEGRVSLTFWSPENLRLIVSYWAFEQLPHSNQKTHRLTWQYELQSAEYLV